MATCRSCGAVIEWVKTERGRNMPVDPEYIEWESAKPGTVVITDTGKTFAAHGLPPWSNFKGRVSHFSTCPEANKWRK